MASNNTQNGMANSPVAGSAAVLLNLDCKFGIMYPLS